MRMEMGIKDHEYYVCPECGDHHWPIEYIRLSSGEVSCKNRFCGVKFRPVVETKKVYSIYELTTCKDEMILFLENCLDTLRIPK